MLSCLLCITTYTCTCIRDISQKKTFLTYQLSSFFVVRYSLRFFLFCWTFFFQMYKDKKGMKSVEVWMASTLEQQSMVSTHSYTKLIRKHLFLEVVQMTCTCSNFMKTSYACRKFLHFGKCRKIFTHCSISALTLKEFLLFYCLSIYMYMYLYMHICRWSIILFDTCTYMYKIIDVHACSYNH